MRIHILGAGALRQWLGFGALERREEVRECWCGKRPNRDEAHVIEDVFIFTNMDARRTLWRFYCTDHAPPYDVVTSCLVGTPYLYYRRASDGSLTSVPEQTVRVFHEL